jgi:hypothetical protein
MIESDKQLADRACQELTRARYTHQKAALGEVGLLREQIGSGDGVERERAEAWLAICTLYDGLSGKSRLSDLDARWQKAIDKTAAWLASIR